MVLTAATAPLVATANTCPTADDLTLGIRLTSSEKRLVNVYRATADGVELTTAATLSDGSIAQSTNLYSTPLTLPLATSFAGTPSSTRYAEPTIGLKNLATTGTWTSSFELWIDGEVSEVGTQTSRLTDTGSQSISGCKYDLWTVQREIRYSDGYIQRSEHIYAPELNVFFVETLFDSGGSPMSATTFDKIQAE